MSEQEDQPQEEPQEDQAPRELGHAPDQAVPDEQEQSMWDAYWERFRRQQVDDPVEERREGLWDRFRRQQVDDPVIRRRSR